MIRIAFLDDYIGVAQGAGDWSGLGPDAEVTFFRDAIPAERLVEELSAYDVVALTQERTRLTRQVLKELPRLKLIVVNTPILFFPDVIDQDYVRDNGILVCGTDSPGNTAVVTSEAVASTMEVAWALIFGLTKRIVSGDQSIRAGGWQTAFQVQLRGLTLGLAGLGNIGREMVGPARAFGMDVIGWSENLTEHKARDLGVRRVSKQDLLRQSDILGVFLHLSERTLHTFKGDDFSLMKPTAFLVNNSRGPIIDEAALIDALRARQIAGAGLDVYEREPLTPNHPLTELDNVVLMPHMGYVTEERVIGFYVLMAETIVAFVKGEPIRVIQIGR